MKIIKFNSFNESIDDVTKLKGWVNIKIDNQVFLRMNRHVRSMDNLLKNSDDKYNLFKKIDILSNVDNYISEKNVDIQTKLSIITILQYLNELRGNFNASSAGFLFEGFLAALIHGELSKDFSSYDMRGKKVIRDVKNLDIDDKYIEVQAPIFKTEKLKYQIKLYKKGSNIEINIKPERRCDYYVICLKDTTDDNKENYKIDIYIISYDELDNYKVISRNKDENQVEYKLKINTNKLYTHEKKRDDKIMRTLDVSDSKINQSIEDCGENIRESLESIYLNLSELEFDIDSIMTGFNKNNVRIDIETAKRNADSTINNIQNSIRNFKI
jgi:hypothetical protein